MSEEELIQLKKLLVEDAIAAIKQQNDQHQQRIEAICKDAVNKVDGFDARIRSLESQRNALIKGAVIYSSVVAVLVAALWRFLMSKIHIG